jgi:hypothetical protein
LDTPLISRYNRYGLGLPFQMLDHHSRGRFTHICIVQLFQIIIIHITCQTRFAAIGNVRRLVCKSHLNFSIVAETPQFTFIVYISDLRTASLTIQGRDLAINENRARISG